MTFEVQAVATHLIFSGASETARTLQSEEKLVQNCSGLFLFQSFSSFLLELRSVKQAELKFWTLHETLYQNI